MYNRIKMFNDCLLPLIYLIEKLYDTVSPFKSWTIRFLLQKSRRCLQRRDPPTVDVLSQHRLVPETVLSASIATFLYTCNLLSPCCLYSTMIFLSCQSSLLGISSNILVLLQNVKSFVQNIFYLALPYVYKPFYLNGVCQSENYYA